MSFSYEFQLHYSQPNSSSSDSFCKISSFSVIGGASGIVHAGSEGYLSLKTLLDQARIQKNVVLFMPWTGSPSDVKAVIDQIESANSKRTITFSFAAFQRSGSNLIYSAFLHDYWAQVAKPPMKTVGDLMMMSFRFGSPSLSDQSPERGQPEG